MSRIDRAEDTLQALSITLAEDVLLALRYHYYCKTRSLVPDALYDSMEREFMARPDTDAFSTPVNHPGSDNPDDYSDRVKALALYIAIARHEENRVTKS